MNLLGKILCFGDTPTDIVGFVNGLPLLFIELKRNDVDVENR